MTKAADRLPSITVPVVLGRVKPDPENGIEGNLGHSLEVSLAYEYQDIKTGIYGPVREIVFVGRGVIGQSMDIMLNDLSIILSRLIQGRDPDTGEEL